MKSIPAFNILKITFFISVTAGLFACNNQSKTSDAASETKPSVSSSELPVFEKLLGTWQNESGKSFERWTKTGDHTYHTSGFSVKGADTTWNEQADVYQENNNWVFEALVSNQNDGKSVKFVASSVSATAVQFSNPAHDFPTDVGYTLPDANTINAFIIGPNDKGGKDTIPFNLRRIR